jgi:hypothetical protein
MRDIIAFTNISDDPYWCEQAEGLRQNLYSFGIDLVINKQPVAKATDLVSLQDQYHRRDAAFVDFASRERRRVLYLDAEVRMHKSLPQHWMDDITVAFYFYGRKITSKGVDGIDYEFAINTGQGIWNKDGKHAYEKTIIQALEHLDKLGFYDEEAFIASNLGPHIREELCMERRYDYGCAATRGFWITENTVFTHPYLHNINHYYKGINSLEMTFITEEFFLAHFSPTDLPLADKVMNLLQEGKNDSWTTENLPLEGLTFSLNTQPPKFLPKHLKKSNAPCYMILDWIFCPNLMLTAPISEWDNNAWTIK